MNNLHLTAALATEHRAQLLKEAEQFRRLRAAKSGPWGRSTSKWALWRYVGLNRTPARAAPVARTPPTATCRLSVPSLAGRESDLVSAHRGESTAVAGHKIRIRAGAGAAGMSAAPSERSASVTDESEPELVRCPI